MIAGRNRTYLVPVAWMVLLFYFSGDAGSFSRTSAIVIPVIRLFFPQMAPRELFALVRIIRKIFHFVDYGILAALWFWALNGGGWSWSWQAGAIALSLSVVYGGLDELHQWFVETRTASLIDVAIDSAGAFFVVAFLFAAGGGEKSRALAFFLWWFVWGAASVALILAPFRGTGSMGLNVALALLVGTTAGLFAVTIARKRGATESRHWYH